MRAAALGLCAACLPYVTIEAQTATTPWQIAGEGSALGLDRASGSHGVAGFGARVDFTLTRRVEIEGRVTLFPNNTIQELQTQGGKALQAAVGVRGKLVVTPDFSVYALLLPGVMHFTNAYINDLDDAPVTGSTTHFALDTGIGIEMYASPRWTMRGEITGPLYAAPGSGPTTIQPNVVYISSPAQMANPWQVTGAVGYRVGPLREPAHENGVAGQWEAGGQVTRLSEPDDNWSIRHRLAVGGFLLSRIAPATYIDAAVNVFPQVIHSHTQWTGGSLFQALAGVAVGLRKDNYGVFVKTRFGLDSYSQVFVGQTVEDLQTLRGFKAIDARRNTPVLDTGGIFERYFLGHWILRFDAGDTLSFYRAMTFTTNGVAEHVSGPPHSTAAGWRF
jgi:hypothetical protein